MQAHLTLLKEPGGDPAVSFRQRHGAGERKWVSDLNGMKLNK